MISGLRPLSLLFSRKRSCVLVAQGKAAGQCVPPKDGRAQDHLRVMCILLPLVEHPVRRLLASDLVFPLLADPHIIRIRFHPMTPTILGMSRRANLSPTERKRFVGWKPFFFFLANRSTRDVWPSSPT